MPIKRAYMVIWLGMVILSACTSQIATPTISPASAGTATASATLKPFRRATSTPLPTNTPPGTATSSHTPTFTPITYTVREEDDMFGIALRYGVSLEALKTANPTVIPRAMSVGTILLIPITPQPTAGPTPTPITPTPTILEVQLPVCYAEASGGMWCFMLVRNARQQSFENVQGVITLTAEGSEPLSQPAYALLNVLPAGAVIPLAAYFPVQPSAPFTPHGEITLALPQPEDDNRYLQVEITDQRTVIANGGLSAQISGRLKLPENSPDASLIWLALTAYAADGQVVGVRKWESLTLLQAGDPRSFLITVYSLGPAITTLNLQSEARP